MSLKVSPRHEESCHQQQISMVAETTMLAATILELQLLYCYDTEASTGSREVRGFARREYTVVDTRRHASVLSLTNDRCPFDCDSTA
jgi:hypothetical protein